MSFPTTPLAAKEQLIERYPSHKEAWLKDWRHTFLLYYPQLADYRFGLEHLESGACKLFLPSESPCWDTAASRIEMCCEQKAPAFVYWHPDHVCSLSGERAILGWAPDGRLVPCRSCDKARRLCDFQSQTLAVVPREKPSPFLEAIWLIAVDEYNGFFSFRSENPGWLEEARQRRDAPVVPPPVAGPASGPAPAPAPAPAAGSTPAPLLSSASASAQDAFDPLIASQPQSLALPASQGVSGPSSSTLPAGQDPPDSSPPAPHAVEEVEELKRRLKEKDLANKQLVGRVDQLEHELDILQQALTDAIDAACA